MYREGEGGEVSSSRPQSRAAAGHIKKKKKSGTGLSAAEKPRRIKNPRTKEGKGRGKAVFSPGKKRGPKNDLDFRSSAPSSRGRAMGKGGNGLRELRGYQGPRGSRGIPKKRDGEKSKQSWADHYLCIRRSERERVGTDSFPVPGNGKGRKEGRSKGEKKEEGRW